MVHRPYECDFRGCCELVRVSENVMAVTAINRMRPYEPNLPNATRCWWALDFVRRLLSASSN
jgi:hypothetical protein